MWVSIILSFCFVELELTLPVQLEELDTENLGSEVYWVSHLYWGLCFIPGSREETLTLPPCPDPT